MKRVKFFGAVVLVAASLFVLHVNHDSNQSSSATVVKVAETMPPVASAATFYLG